MKVNLFPPALIFTSDKEGGGRTYFWLLILPVIVMRPSYGKTLLEHELFHARQYFMLLILPYWILNATKWGEFRLEAAAYGHAAQYADNPNNYIMSVAGYLASDAYKHGRTLEECIEQIEKKFLKGGII